MCTKNVENVLKQFDMYILEKGKTNIKKKTKKELLKTGKKWPN